MAKETFDEFAALRKEDHLVRYLQGLGKVLVAFSGGVDSTYLMSVAQQAAGENALAVFARGAMISAQENEEAVSLANSLKIPLKIIDLDILTLDEFVNNSVDRCYHCKKAIFGRFQELKAKEGYIILDGSNLSDEGDFRPGRKALAELGVKSPLREVGLTKEEIRFLSKRRGLPTWNKPSMACLASRIPYGEKITADLLKRINQAEEVLQSRGFGERRVRIHGEIARIEIPPVEFARFMEYRSEIVSMLLELGFSYVTLDLQGIRSGSLNPVQGG